MSLWKSGKVWTYQFTWRGQRYSKSGFKTKLEARKAQEQRRSEVRGGKTQTGMAFSEVANVYLDHCKRRFAKKTYEYKAMVYREFLSCNGDCLFTAITTNALHRYLHMRPTNNNYNAHRKDLCALFSFGFKVLGINAPHPCWNLDKMPIRKTEKEIPSQMDVLEVLVAATPEEEALLLVILHTAGRIDEILRLTWEDVNFEHGYIRLRTRKKTGGHWKADDMPMNKDARGALEVMWKNRLQGKWVFFNKKTGTRYNRRPKLMPALCKKAGVKPFGFHALRHAAASMLNDRFKISMPTIQRILRHDSQRTSEIYVHSIPEEVRQAMEKLEGVWG